MENVPVKPANAPVAPTVKSTVPAGSSPGVAPAKTTQAASISAQVAKANAIQSPLVKALAAGTKSTQDIVSPWLRLLLHGEIDSLKTTTAAHFGTPEQTRIILTRGVDQLIPIKNEGYKYVSIPEVALRSHVTEATAFAEAMQHCEHIWPEWASQPEPVLIVDDLSRAKDFVLRDSSTYLKDGMEIEFKDNRKIHVTALKEMDAIFSTLNRKPIHIILVALSKVRENPITQEESIFPDLPPAMSNLVMSDYSYIFFINKKKPRNACLLTSKDFEAVSEYDEQQKKTITYQRFFFARHKLPVELEAKGIIKQYEALDLRAVWNKIKGGGTQ